MKALFSLLIAVLILSHTTIQSQQTNKISYTEPPFYTQNFNYGEHNLLLHLEFEITITLEADADRAVDLENTMISLEVTSSVAGEASWIQRNLNPLIWQAGPNYVKPVLGWDLTQPERKQVSLWNRFKKVNLKSSEQYLQLGVPEGFGVRFAL
ncbi:hypothetical protein [Poritiphilus flavus]|uniref:Uncharacterized protein n=1 Tax=Poritiphilus flavus TaxID=2697053 RepID=A0A6L9ED60_9FLAO|nr:hypothetical protein [Poritiphilus flavus]NAS12680.1 hypothetical protein [Poritiphilus flavus]